MNNFFKHVWDFICFTLILIGIVGLCWEAFGDKGWVEKLWGVAWNMEISHPILATPIIGGTLLLVVIFARGELQTGKVSKFHDMLIYITMIAGVYFAVRFLLSVK